MQNKYFSLLFRIILGLVFVYASIDKIEHPSQFVVSIENYRLIPAGLSYYAAMFLPWLELFCGLFLIGGAFVKTSAGIIGGMLLSFMVALISALLRGLDIDCGCFSVNPNSASVSVFRLLEDVFLLAMAVYLIYFYKPYLRRQVLENTDG